MKDNKIIISNLSQAMEKVMELQKRAIVNKPKPIEMNLAKLMEEVGEIAQDVLKLDGYKTNNESKSSIKKNLQEEIADAMVMLFVLSFDTGMSEEKLCKIFEKKLQKWVKKHIEPSERKKG